MIKERIHPGHIITVHNKKYDGWVIKSYCAKNPFIVAEWFSTTKKRAIEKYDEMFGKGTWKALRKRGALELIKVRFVEVE